MSLSKVDIAGMLYEYENDFHTGMDTDEIAGLFYDHTAGYPYLVSRICKLIDEKIVGSIEFSDRTAAWDCRHIFVRERFLRFLPGEKRRLTIIVPGGFVRKLAVNEVMAFCY